MTEPTDDDTRISDAAADRLFARILAGEPVGEAAAAVPESAGRAAKALRDVYAIFGGEAPPNAAAERANAKRSPADPRRFGRFALIEELGRGGQGAVWRARDEKSGETVALKFLDQRARLSASAVARLRREQTVLGKLDHPSIARIRDAGVEDDIPWIAMELIDGIPLSRWIADRRDRGFFGPVPDVRTCFTFFEKAARAIRFAHELGVLHRDIKPGNIMVRADGTPVILDFGLAEDAAGETTRVTQTGDLLGTPAYLAPEQLTRQAIRADHRTDVWGLGVTFYEALTGRPPFEAPTRERLYAAILAQEPQSPSRLDPKLPKAASVCIATALAKDRDRRYADMGAFADDLARLADNRPILARPERRPMAIARWIARHPALAVIMALFLVLVALSGYLAARWGDLEAGRTAERRARLAARLEDGYLALGEISLDAAKGVFDDCITIERRSAEAWAGRILAEARFHDGAFRTPDANAWSNGRRLLEEARTACGDAPALRPLRRYFAMEPAKIDRRSLVVDFRRADSPDAMELFTAGVLLLQVGHAGEIDAFDAATDLLLTAALRVDGDSAMIDYQLTHAAAHARRTDIARRMAAILPARYPHSPTANYWAGFAALDEDPARAAGLFENAVRIKPDFLRARLDIVYALTRAGRKAEAKTAADALLERFPKTPSALATVAAVLEDGGERARAEEIAEEALALDGDEHIALAVRGKAALERRDLAAAREALDRALVVWPNDATCLRLRATLAVFEGRPEGAEADLLHCIRLRPADLEPRIALVQLRLNHLRIGEAKGMIDDLIKDHPDHPGLLQLRGNVAMAEQRFGDAARDLERAVRAMPESAEARRQYAGVLALCGESEAAEKLLARLDLTDPLNLWAEAQRLYWAGRLDEALTAFETAAARGKGLPGFPTGADQRILECKTALAELAPLFEAIESPATVRTDLAVKAAGSAYALRLFHLGDRGLRRLAEAGRIDLGRPDDANVHVLRIAIARAAAKADAATDLPGARTVLDGALGLFEIFLDRAEAAIEDEKLTPARAGVWVEVFAKDPFVSAITAAPDDVFPAEKREKLAACIRRLGILAAE